MKFIFFILLFITATSVPVFAEPGSNLNGFIGCCVLASESSDDVIDINENVENETGYVFLTGGEIKNQQSDSNLIIKIKNDILTPFLKDILRPPNFV